MHKYQLLTQIGHGAYSIVFKARNQITNNIVAIKRINHTNPDISLVLGRQIKALQSLQHPNIIRLLEVCSDHQYAYLVFEYLPYDLITYYKQVKKTKARNLNDEEIVYISWQMCQALGYMHRNGLMHRDIKPQNVLIDPSNLSVKLIDFGFATCVNQYGQNTQYMITRWYRPLQIVLNLPYDGKADIFAMGALLLELYLGEEVFRSASNLDQLYWILQICGYPSNWPQAIQKMNLLGINYSQTKQPQILKLTNGLRHQAANLIRCMLNTNPYKRYSIIQILNHPYFSEMKQNRMRKNSITYRSSNPLPNSYSNPILKSSMIRYTMPEQNKDITQSALKNLKAKINSSNSTNNLSSNVSKLQKMKKGLSLQRNDPIIERYQNKISNLYSPNNKNDELQFKMDKNKFALKQSKQFFVEKSSNPLKNALNDKQQQQANKVNKANKTQLYGFIKKTENNQKSDQNLKFYNNNTQKKTVRYKTEGYENQYSKQKQIDKQLQKDLQYLRKHGHLPSHFRNSSSNQTQKNKDKLQIDQQSKGLKFRTKSYQGISVVSLKKDTNTGFNNLDKYNPNMIMSNNSNLSKGYNSVIKNPQRSYQTTYQTNINLGYSTQTAANGNYVGGYRNELPIHNLQNHIKRKQPTFTKIRDKLLNDNKPLGKIKISLTQREKGLLFEQHNNPHKHYQVRNFV